MVINGITSTILQTLTEFQAISIYQTWDHCSPVALKPCSMEKCYSKMRALTSKALISILAELIIAFLWFIIHSNCLARFDMPYRGHLAFRRKWLKVMPEDINNSYCPDWIHESLIENAIPSGNYFPEEFSSTRNSTCIFCNLRWFFAILSGIRYLEWAIFSMLALS